MAGFEELEAQDPRQVGRYRIVARLGAGGMGRVYLGRSPGGRAVAVKVVRSELAEDGEFRRRFGREVAAARRVNGIFTAGVVDADPDGSPPWLATAYVPGTSLGEAVSEHGPWLPSSVLALGAALAEALEAIHAAEVIHRDLKPSNVLLAADGPRVIDFGISVAGESSKLTRTGMTIGTPGFMSPEQITGKPVGPASDVFSLGAVLAFTATGAGPFGTDSAHVLYFRTVYEEPDLQALPPDLREIVGSCLAKDPDQRPTVPMLLDRLAEAAGGERASTQVLTGTAWLPEPVARAIHQRTTPPHQPSSPPPSQPDTVQADPPSPAPPATVPAQPPSSQDRSPATPPPADQAPDQPPTRTAVPAARPEPQPPADAAPRSAGITRRRALFGIAATAATAGFGLAAWKVLDRPDKPDQPDPLDQPGPLKESDPPDESDPHDQVDQSDQAGEERWKLETGDAVSSSPVVADGVVYVGSWDGNLYAVEADTGKERWRFTTGNAVESSPAVANGLVYVGSNDYNLYAVEADTGKERWKFKTGHEVVSSPVVADGVVYVGSSDGNLYAVEADTGKQRWRFTTGDAVSSSPVVADGVVYVGSWDGNLYAVEADTGKQRWRFTTGDAVESSPAVANGLVYVGSYDDILYGVEADTGRQRWKFTTGDAVISSPAVADGVVYVGSWDGNLYAVEADTGRERWKFKAGDRVSSSPVVADGVVYVGSQMFAGISNLYAVEADTGGERWRFTTGNAVNSSPVVANGLVYVGSYDHSLYAVTV